MTVLRYHLKRRENIAGLRSLSSRSKHHPRHSVDQYQLDKMIPVPRINREDVAVAAMLDAMAAASAMAEMKDRPPPPPRRSERLRG